ncbi:hypothetical protein AB0E25_35425 [Streptomyces bobili]|uniref:hypothetical protein n=1 Tax=Streptomyces bobili TaxID=67280 RepID=UPI0033DCEE78
MSIETAPVEPAKSTDELRHSMVEFLMAVIGAPDDEEIARDADEVVRLLDARLAEEPRG